MSDGNKIEFSVGLDTKDAIRAARELADSIKKAVSIKLNDPALKDQEATLKSINREVQKRITTLDSEQTVQDRINQFLKDRVSLQEKVSQLSDLREKKAEKEAILRQKEENYANKHAGQPDTKRALASMATIDRLKAEISTIDSEIVNTKNDIESLSWSISKDEVYFAKMQDRANSFKADFENVAIDGERLVDSVGNVASETQRASDSAKSFNEAVGGAGNEAKDAFNDVEEGVEGVGTAAEEAKSKAQEAFDAIKESSEGLENFGIDLNADVTQMDFASLDEYKKSITEILSLISKLGLQDEFREFFNEGTEAVTRANAQINFLKGNITSAQKELNKPVKEPTLTFGVDADTAKMSIQELVQHLAELKARMKYVGEGSSEFKALYDATIRTSNAINAYKRSFKDTGDTASKEMQRAKQALSLVSKSASIVQRGIKSIESSFHKLASVVKSVAKKIISVFRGIASTISGAVKNAFDKLGKSSEKAFSSRNLKRTLTMLTKYIFGVRSFFFLYRKLRKLVGEGLENLVQFESATNETNHAITELRTSLLFIKNAWAAAFAPIINVVYPILVGLMDMLAAVGNAIARFVAALTGQATVLQAVRVSAGDYADSLAQAGGSAGKAADEQEKLNKKLAAFDDLNVLGLDDDDDPNKGNGGGGGGADDLIDPNTMFERIATPMTDLVKLIQQAWETGNAFKLGEFFATRLSDSLDEAYDWLTGEGRAKVMKIGGLIGSFIDGWLSVDDLGTKFGTVIGAAFELAMDFLNSIITPNRMLKVGVQMADALNAAIPMILPKLGETIGNLFKSSIANAWGFLTTADFKGWGEAISSAFNNFISEMNQDVTITTAKGNLEWGGKVENTGLNGWEMLGQNVTMIAQGMLDMLGEAIGGADWSGLGKGIGTAIENIDVEAIKGSLKKLADKIGSALQELWGGFEEGNPEGSSSIEGLFKGAIDMLPGLIALGATIGVIAGGLKLISTAITIIAPIASVLLPMLSTTGLSGLTGIAGALVSIAPSLVIVAGVIGGFVETLFAASQGFEDGEKGTMSFGGALINGIGGAIPIVVYWINYLWGKLGLLSDKFEAVKLIVISVLSSISEKFAIVFLAARTLWITFKGTITRGIEALQTSFEGFGAMISAIFSGDIRSALNIAIGAIESFLNTCLQGIADFANSPALGGIAGLAGRTVSSVASTTITLPRIPALAQGAVIPPNNQFLAILGDQTSGTNIEAPLDTIQQAVGAELAPYLQELIAVNRQVIQAINAKPVISKNDIGKANAQYVAQQKIIRGTML